MLIGVYWGYVAMIEGLIARMRAEIDRPLTIIATGGLAPLFQKQAHLFDRVAPDLTLNGLMYLYNQRSPKSEARRVGKRCVSTGRSRRSPYHYNKNQRTK